MKNFFSRERIQKIRTYILAHKKMSGIAFVAVLLFGYWCYGKLGNNGADQQYAIATVQKRTIIVSITGNGQVSASSQIDLKPKASGDIVWVSVKSGQEVSRGAALVYLDNADAKKAVADAELDLEESRMQLEKNIAQAPIDYQRKQESLAKAKDALEKEYEDSFNAVSDAFLDLPAVMTSAENVLYGDELGGGTGQFNVSAYRDMFQNEDKELVISVAAIAEKDYQTARANYDTNFDDFKKITRYSEKTELEDLLKETLVTTKSVAQALKSEMNLLDTVVDLAERKNLRLNATVTNFQSDLKTKLGTVNGNLSSLLSRDRSLEDAKETITNIERDISILKINNPAGENPIDLQISKNAIKKKEVNLADLKSKLADYAVYAPFDGVIASVNAKVGDSASSGSVLATIVTKQKIAEISLNEVDVAKIKTGQKATLTFDAIEELSITGEVAEVDSIGTVSQGVVTYNIKISFDAQDDRIKPGMSVSAAIITDVKQDVLVVANSAVKSQGGINYVEMLDKSVPLAQSSQNIISTILPSQQQVEIGLSSDAQTEIISGLNEGDQIIVRTITPSTSKTTTQQAPSLFGTGGGNRSGTSGGVMRMIPRD